MMTGGGGAVTNRFLGIAIFWLLVLITAFVAEPYLTAWRFSATAPRIVAPREDLSEAERTSIKLFQNVSPSVVAVFARKNPEKLLARGQDKGEVQTGSGIIWDAAGHVITNYHVIKGTDQFAAHLSTGEPVAVRVIATAPNYDLAVLQLERTPNPLRPIAVGRSSTLQVGQFAFAIGDPYGLEQTMTSGIISALRRSIPAQDGHEITGAIQTDAPLNPGNSGGPLLDSSGRLIGVTTMIISGSGASAGVGIALPVDLVNRVVTELISTGHVPTPGIGIAVASETESAQLGVDGVIILKVFPNSVAAKAGLKGATASGEVKDVITAVNGQKVNDVTDLTAIFEQLGVGKTVTLTVQRGDKSRTVDIPLADVSQRQG
jgi:2-alkenal reductase